VSTECPVAASYPANVGPVELDGRDGASTVGGCREAYDSDIAVVRACRYDVIRSAVPGLLDKEPRHRPRSAASLLAWSRSPAIGYGRRTTREPRGTPDPLSAGDAAEPR